MSSLTIELPSQREQTQFNLRRWDELLDDPEISKIEWRVETDRYGHIIVMPPPGAKHGSFQSEIAFLMRSNLSQGRAITECPISTADGVKAADVAWASKESLASLGEKNCFPRAPEICVEVLSPDNSEAEMREKMALYFDAGAREAWICNLDGEMSFFAAGLVTLEHSRICPAFPQKVVLP